MEGVDVDGKTKGLAWALIAGAPVRAADGVGLLMLRVCFGGLMALRHGVPKLVRYGDLSETFVDPIWLGGTRSIQLTIFAELFCSVAVVLGLATRLALVPLIWTMTVAAFIVHAADPLARKELALVYLAAFVALLFLGPGRYSVDALVRRKLGSE